MSLTSTKLSKFQKITLAIIIFLLIGGLHYYNKLSEQASISERTNNLTVTYVHEVMEYNNGVTFLTGTKAKNHYKSWKVGEWNEFDDNGNLLNNEVFDSIGNVISFKEYYTNGVLKRHLENIPDGDIIIRYDSLGNKAYESSLVVIEGNDSDESYVSEKYFANNSIVKEETYINGEEDNKTVKTFHSNGKLRRHYKLNNYDYDWIKVYDKKGTLTLDESF